MKVSPAHYSSLRPYERRIKRLEYVAAQGNRCFWCGKPLDGPPAEAVTSKTVNWKLFPPTFRKNPVHLQHDHVTGMTEGAVHMMCNAVMWQYHGR